MILRCVCIVFFALTICFSSGLQAQFNVIGDADDLGGDCYQLTDTKDFEFGAIWSNELINLNESFEAQFQLYFGTKDEDGADGIAFIFQPISDNIGSAGGGIGFSGIDPSLGIVFDTWQNTDNNDPTEDHITLMQNGDLNHNTALSPAVTVDNIEDGMWYDVRVVWNVNTSELNVFWECGLLLSYTGDIVEDIFDGDPMVYWGFTSATGGANNVHSVCIDYISFLDGLSDHQICEGERILIGGEANPDYTYSWTPTNTLNDPTLSNPEASPTETTTYILELTDGCQFSFYDTVVVSVISIPIELGEDINACEGETILLGATTPNAIYQWQDGSTEASFEVIESGTYAVTVTVTVNQCIATDEITVTFNEAPIIDLGADTTLCVGESLVLVAPSADSYLWQDGSTNVGLEVTESGVYSVEAIAGTCVSTGEIQVDFEVCEEPVEETFVLTIPNAFSPNADGVNDEFRVLATDSPDEFYCVVFNRWGKKVFETTDINDTWDGVFKKRLQPIGVYVFYVEAWKELNGERKRFWQQGNVTLVR